MKLSTIQANRVREYMRLEDDDSLIELVIMPAAKSFIKSYTGLSDEAMDEVESLTIAFLVLCDEMYDNRTYTVDKDTLNPTVKTILDMYSVNLLGSVDDV